MFEAVAAMSAEEKKGKQSLMVTTITQKMKGNKATLEEISMLEMYKDLPRADSAKDLILANWMKDRSCKW